MSQINPGILAQLAMAQAGQASPNSPLSSDPTAEARNSVHPGHARMDAMGATATHPHAGRGSVMARSLPEDRSPTRENPQTGVEEGDSNVPTEAAHEETGGVGTTAAAQEGAMKYNAGLGDWLKQQPPAQQPAAAPQQFSYQNVPGYQQKVAALANSSTPVQQTQTPESRLDNYENMLSQSDPKAAAELAIKRQELGMKQQQHEADLQTKQLNMNMKMTPMSGGSAASDAEGAAKSEQKSEEKAAAKGTAKPSLNDIVQQLKGGSAQAAPSPAVKQTAMAQPAQTMMARLAMHQKAKMITPGTQFAKGEFYKSPGTGRVHQHIGNGPDGEPRFTPALA